MSLHVCNMHGFQINAQPLQPAQTLDSEEICAPVTGNPSTANQSLDTDTYKDISKKKQLKKEILNNISASDDAQNISEQSFDIFWNIYPIKKNKIRSKKIWERKNLNRIAELICLDIANRKSTDDSWKDERFIPHPSTYLLNERWNDSISKFEQPNKPTKTSGGDSLSKIFKKHTNQGGTYDQFGNSVNP